MVNAYHTDGNDKIDPSRSDRYDSAIWIFWNTLDGDDLGEFELWIVQGTINNRLNAQKPSDGATRAAN